MNDSSSQQGRWQKVGAWLRGQRGWLTISQYHEDDIRAEQPVLITAAGAVHGTIIAPKVVVAGRVGGDVAGMTVTIEKGGAVWGNVAAAEMELQPGGKLHGWFLTIDEDSFLLLQADEANMADMTAAESVAAAEEDDSGMTSTLNAGQLAHFRRLQAEAAAAVMAKAELDLVFEERVEAAAGEKIAEAATLREEITVLRGDLLQVQAQVNERQKSVEELNRQLDSVNEELLESRRNLAENVARVAELEEKHQSATDTLFRTTSERDMLNDELADQLTRVETLTERLNNMEVAMQASLQRTAEQEDSLIRWQELAEVSEERAERLDEEASVLRSRLADSSKIADSLRSERDRYRTEFETLTEESEAATARVATLEQELAQVQEQLALVQEQFDQKMDEFQAREEAETSETGDWDALRASLAETRSQLEENKGNFLSAQERISELEERLVWTNASEQAASAELMRIRQQLAQQTEKIKALTETVEQQTTLAENWKNNVNRTLKMLFAAEQQVEQLQANLEEARSQQDGGTPRAEILRLRMRLEAAEKDLNRYLAESERQGTLLSEMQAEIVERDVALQRLDKKNVDQTRQLTRLKKAARERVDALNVELARTRQQLDDLTQWVDRQRRQGRFPQRES